ncbi:C1 family peptidase, partial [Candidatus Bathyarchaeota archaeon]|nr:C1 family peptidase [Candidatus Bathyarchaeota archaeon]
MKRFISRIMIMLLLVSLSVLAFDIKMVRASSRRTHTRVNGLNMDSETSKAETFFNVNAACFSRNESNMKRGAEGATIVEHKITPTELERLKREVGVWQKSGTYNHLIGGYGTGLRPPKEEDWDDIAAKTYTVESILPSKTFQNPSYVDHTTTPWFPPIGNQNGEGSCVAWAVGYYMKTFQEAKEHAWDLSQATWEGGYSGHPTSIYQDRIISPDFIYHLVNYGEDEGSSYHSAISLICQIGASSWEKMPYDPSDHTTWPSEEAWAEAPLYRGNSSGYESLWFDTDEDLLDLKNWIASDNLAVISIDADKYSSLTGDDFWTLDNYVNPSTNHANTIVGYDDFILYEEEGQPSHGAFKVANSWGEGGWENTADGCYWISYEAMKQRVGYCMFYRDRVEYEPELVASFKLAHSRRRECHITVGMGDPSS